MTKINIIYSVTSQLPDYDLITKKIPSGEKFNKLKVIGIIIFETDCFKSQNLCTSSNTFLHMDITFPMSVFTAQFKGIARNLIKLEEVARSCSVKKMFLEILQNSPENTSPFFNKVAGLRPYLF